MKIMLTGGSANGKSTYGEKLALSFPGPHHYLAAMKPYGPEAAARIARHRAAHTRQGFVTLERYTDLAGLELPEKGGTVLLECLCNLLDNEMFDETGSARDVTGQILKGLDWLAAQCETLIVVTNDVGSDLRAYGPATLAYMDQMGRLNCQAARTMDCVAEVAAGIPVVRQGSFCLPDFSEKGEGNMILVIGGAASGKRTYAKSLGYGPQDMSTDIFDDKPVLYDLHRLIAEAPEQSEQWLPRLLQKKVVICSEVGSGIIPGEPRQRRVREQTGRLCSLLAAQAGMVVRMVCGIPQRLK